MSELHDEKLIRALRSAGTDGPAFAMTPLHETTRRGRAARRRRTVLTGAGTTVLAAATVTAALAVPPLLDGQDVVPAPAIDPTEDSTNEPTDEPGGEAIPRTAAEMIAAYKATVFEALPDGFVRLTDENRELGDNMAGFAVAQEPPATDGLPDGIKGGISLRIGAAGGSSGPPAGLCDARTEKGSVTSACVDLEIAGKTVQVQETSQPGTDFGMAWESTRTIYEHPSGNLIMVDLYAWETDLTGAARLKEARAWVDTMHEQIASIAVHPSFQPTEWRERSLAEAEEFAADLGGNWYVLDQPPGAAVRPSEALEASLPEGTSVGVTRDVLRDADLSELCAARTEDGIRREPCEPAPGGDTMVSYGVMVDPAHGGEESFDTRLADVVVYHEQDGSIVEVRVIVAGMGAMGTDSAPDPSSLRPWLEEQVPDLVRAAISADH